MFNRTKYKDSNQNTILNLQNVVPLLLPIVESGGAICDMTPARPPSSASTSTSTTGDEYLVYQTLLTLTNIAALSDWHKQFSSSLTRFVTHLLSRAGSP